MSWEVDHTTRRLPSLPGSASFWAIVIVDGVATKVALPERGEVVIGRSEGVGLRIQHESVSRRHAVLRVGDEITYEDTGSANGSRVGEQRLEPGRAVTVGLNEVIDVGTTMLVLQGRSPVLGEEPVVLAKKRDTRGYVVVAPEMLRLHRLLERVAESSINVLLLGETGTGKEGLAELVHHMSRRSRQPFLRLNCAALSEQLLESELFGHVKGAFTSADRDKVGLLESAHGGTVLLDEVGDMPMALQAKLLRVLEGGELLRVGAVKATRVDVRFVSATHRDLKQRILEGHFRTDLYYRLNGLSVVVPPLRDRPTEIVPLCEHFLKKASRRPRLAAETVRILTAYEWPGNVRQLRNVIEQAVVLCDGDEVLPEHLPLHEMQPGASASPLAAAPAADLQAAVSQTERQAILEALDACGGNQTRAAERLGVSRSTLVRRLQQFGVTRPRKS
jgi:two-component system, NtrC family, response regulator AtoC